MKDDEFSYIIAPGDADCDSLFKGLFYCLEPSTHDFLCKKDHLTKTSEISFSKLRCPIKVL